MTPAERSALTDLEVVALYARWAEWAYSADFLAPAPVSVRAFRRWLLAQRDRGITEPYEHALLAEWRRQEGAVAP